MLLNKFEQYLLDRERTIDIEYGTKVLAMIDVYMLLPDPRAKKKT
jgi:hypothetical protein